MSVFNAITRLPGGWLAARVVEKARLKQWAWMKDAFFDEAFYLAEYPDVGAGGLEAFGHFLRHGMAENRTPNREFDPDYYRLTHKEARKSDLGAFEHFVRVGAAKGMDPNARFNEDFYRTQCGDMEGLTAQEHFLRIGWAKGYACGSDHDLLSYLPSRQQPPKAPKGLKVGVIVPCYKGLEETRACIESVLGSPCETTFELLVIDDAGPEPELSAYLASLDGQGPVTALKNEKNLGFVGTVNRGMRHFKKMDVVLLNSDTVVAPGWLDRLAARAHGADDVGTVTPYSNNATICSYPDMRGMRSIPGGLSPEDMDRVFAEVNAGRSFDIPTGVGFCMYIREHCLADVGLFDEEAFGKGYGEENDFCLKAEARGFRNLLAADVFVYHAGEVSFQADAASGKENGLATIKERYPDYQRKVRAHIGLDPGKPCRFAVTARRWKDSDLPVVLFISHGFGGGTETHVRRLVKFFDGRARFLMLSPLTGLSGGHDPRVRLYSLHKDDPAEVIMDGDADFPLLVEILQSFGVAKVHVHHLHAVSLDVRGLIRFLDVPFDFTVHDYYTICPHFFLMPGEREYCGEPGTGGCQACIAQDKGVHAPDIIWYRKCFDWLYRESDNVICPSRDVAARVARYQPSENLVAALHTTLNEPKPAPVKAPPLAKGEKLRVAVIGMLAKRKGAEVVAQTALAARKAGYDLSFHIIGKATVGMPFSPEAELFETGEYAEDELPGLIAEINPHVVWFPAKWPETFSYTLSEAKQAGLPVVLTNLGAFVERVRSREWTWMVDWDLAPKKMAGFFDSIRKKHFLPGKAPAPLKVENAPDWHRTPPDFYDAEYLRIKAPEPLIEITRPERITVAALTHVNDLGAPDPCAYIRAVLPLDHPGAGRDVDYVLVNTDQLFHHRADVILTHRTAVADLSLARRVVAHARDTGAKLAYDLDDALLDISGTHPEFHFYRHAKQAILEFVTSADMVTASTEHMRARLAGLNPNTVLVPNGLDERIWLSDEVKAPEKQKGKVSFVYMGTMTHAKDLLIVEQAMRLLRRKHGEAISFNLVGVTPDEQDGEWASRVKVPSKATKGYPGFVQWLRSVNKWDVGLAPLADSGFNDTKSGIKYMDYAALGLVPVCSSVKAYQDVVEHGKTGLLVENTPEAWFSALDGLVSDASKRKRLARQAREDLLARHTLKAQAGFRSELLRRLATSNAK